jgi:hypothetical protein
VLLVGLELLLQFLGLMVQQQWLQGLLAVVVLTLTLVQEVNTRTPLLEHLQVSHTRTHHRFLELNTHTLYLRLRHFLVQQLTLLLDTLMLLPQPKTNDY